MPHSAKAHTPITSEAQRGKFGAEYSRRKRGKKRRMKGITTEELRAHLKEAGGKNLPQYADKAAALDRRAKRGKPRRRKKKK